MVSNRHIYFKKQHNKRNRDIILQYKRFKWKKYIKAAERNMVQADINRVTKLFSDPDCKMMKYGRAKQRYSID